MLKNISVVEILLLIGVAGISFSFFLPFFN